MLRRSRISPSISLGLTTAVVLIQSAFAEPTLYPAQQATVYVESKVIEPSGHTTKEKGTGILVTPTGFIITANHLVSANASATVEIAFHSPTEKNRLEATVWHLPIQCCDLVLLKISDKEGPFPAIELADSRSVSQGQSVVALGYTFGREISELPGFVASTDWSSTSSGPRLSFPGSWRLTNQMNYGDSGAPVLDPSGKVVAIVTGGDPTAQGVAIATPSYYAVRLLEYVGAPLPPWWPANRPPPPTQVSQAKQPSNVVVTPATGGPIAQGITVTSESLPSYDWTGALEFHITNDYDYGMLMVSTGDDAGVLYDVTGVYKVDRRNASVHFRVDKIQLKLNTTLPVSVTTSLLQFGMCHKVAGPKGAWDISPSRPGSLNSRDLSLKLEPSKEYTLNDNIEPLAIPNEGLDLTRVWPCTLLWTNLGGRYSAMETWFVPIVHKQTMRRLKPG